MPMHDKCALKCEHDKSCGRISLEKGGKALFFLPNDKPARCPEGFSWVQMVKAVDRIEGVERDFFALVRPNCKDDNPSTRLRAGFVMETRGVTRINPVSGLVEEVVEDGVKTGTCWPCDNATVDEACALIATTSEQARLIVTALYRFFRFEPAFPGIVFNVKAATTTVMLPTYRIKHSPMEPIVGRLLLPGWIGPLRTAASAMGPLHFARHVTYDEQKPPLAWGRGHTYRRVVICDGVVAAENDDGRGSPAFKSVGPVADQLPARFNEFCDPSDPPLSVKKFLAARAVEPIAGDPCFAVEKIDGYMWTDIQQAVALSRALSRPSERKRSVRWADREGCKKSKDDNSAIIESSDEDDDAIIESSDEDNDAFIESSDEETRE